MVNHKLLAMQLQSRRKNEIRYHRFVDPNVRRNEARSADYIQIYDSIVIEFFLRLKIHRVCADVPRFDIENFNSIVSMAKP